MFIPNERNVRMSALQYRLLPLGSSFHPLKVYSPLEQQNVAKNILINIEVIRTNSSLILSYNAVIVFIFKEFTSIN